ncbi:MAG: protein phosphatase 2C domain-containing protein [Lachnospiraceae bacterium]|nr:protein phosphatase 2C domain-containing protein [Lachnospiraceae bacterium]
MQTAIIKKSVQGASHKASNKICQDAHKVIRTENGAYVLAVADGHGSSVCRLSDRGAKKAVETFCDIAKGVLNLSVPENDILEIFAGKGKKEIPKIVSERWKERVQKSFEQLSIKDESLNDSNVSVPELYGSTLLGLVITDKYIYAMQIGDGDIVFVSENGVNYVIEPPKFLGTETFSLSNEKPWENVVIHFQRIEYKEKVPCMFMLSSDGFSNSFKDDEQFFVAAKEYFETLKTYGGNRVQRELGNWLSQTSEEGCGDDITLVAIGFFEDEPSITEDTDDIEVADESENCAMQEQLDSATS